MKDTSKAIEEVVSGNDAWKDDDSDINEIVKKLIDDPAFIQAIEDKLAESDDDQSEDADSSSDGSSESDNDVKDDDDKAEWGNHTNALAKLISQYKV
jgi:hypothetical protein